MVEGLARRAACCRHPRARAGADSARAIRSSRARRDRSAPTRARAAAARRAAASGERSVSSIARASARGIAGLDQQPVDPVANQRRRAAHRGGDHRRPARHRLEQAVGRALAVRGLDEHVEAAQHVLGVGAVAEEAATIENAEAPRFLLEPRAARAGTRDHQPQLRDAPPSPPRTPRSGDPDASRDRAARGFRSRCSSSPTPHSRAHSRARRRRRDGRSRRRPRWAASSTLCSSPRARPINRSRRSSDTANTSGNERSSRRSAG